MAVQQDVSGLKRRQVGCIVFMTVCSKEQMAAHRKQGVCCHDGEVQDHLIDFAVTVAAYTGDLLFVCIELRKHVFGQIFFGQVIAGTVVENVAQQDEPAGIFFFKLQ